MATNDKPTIVDGKPTGDYTKNGKYNIHDGDTGQFAPKDSVSSGEENKVEIIDKSPFESFLAKTKYADIIERIKSVPDVKKREEALKRIEELINQEIENNKYLGSVHSLKNYVLNRGNRIANDPRYFDYPTYTPEQRKVLTKKLDECLENSDFCIRVKIGSDYSKGYIKLLEDNKFKNQIELGRGYSGGYDEPKERFAFSQKVFGVDLDWGEDGYTEIEKYGYLESKDISKKVLNTGPDQYGPIMFTFKKDRVKNRTTYTIGDSLQNYQAPCLFGEDADEFVLRPRRRSPSELTRSGFSYCKDANDLQNFWHELYVEAQYHGHLNVSDDVESMLIPKSQLERDKEKIYELIKKHGYQFEISAYTRKYGDYPTIQKVIFKEDGSLEYIE